MDNPKEIPKKMHWLVLMSAGILAIADLAALCFGLAMLFIALWGSPRDAGPLIVVIYGGILCSPILGLLLMATILLVVLAKRVARTFRVVLLLLIAVAVVADAIAVAWAFHLPKFGSIEIPAAKKSCAPYLGGAFGALFLWGGKTMVSLYGIYAMNTRLLTEDEFRAMCKGAMENVTGRESDVMAQCLDA